MLAVNPLPGQNNSGKLVNVQSAKFVLLFNCSSTDELEVISKLLNNTKVSNFNINSVGIFFCNAVADAVNFDNKITIINQNDFTVFGSEKKNLSNWISSSKCNILLSFADGDNIYCNRITSSIDADFKAGKYSKINADLYDLTLVFKTKDYLKQFDNFIHYITNLNINT